MKVRASLLELSGDLDPEGDDGALQRMVLVGHSQGGLVSRLLVASSGDETWARVSDVPLEELGLDQASQELLRDCIWFEPLPFVDRVVFVSTPHRGSFIAGGWIGKLARSLISLPGDLTRTAEGLIKRPDLPYRLRRITTSVENMEPDSAS